MNVNLGPAPGTRRSLEIISVGCAAGTLFLASTDKWSIITSTTLIDPSPIMHGALVCSGWLSPVHLDNHTNEALEHYTMSRFITKILSENYLDIIYR